MAIITVNSRQRVVATARFYSDSEQTTPADPTSVYFAIRKRGSDDVTTLVYGTDLAVEKASVGVYTCKIEDLDAGGTYFLESYGTGDVHTGCQDGIIQVKKNPVAEDLGGGGSAY